MPRWKFTGRRCATGNGRMPGRHGLRHCPNGTRASIRHRADGAPARTRNALRHPGMRRASSSTALHGPLVSLAFQDIIHGHAGARCVVSFRLKVHRGSSFVLAKRDRRDTNVHREQIGALGKVVQHPLLHGVLIIDVAATAQPCDRQRERNSSISGSFHIPIISTRRHVTLSQTRGLDRNGLDVALGPERKANSDSIQA